MAEDRTYRYKGAWRGSTRQAAFARDGGCVRCGDRGSDGMGRGLHLAHVVRHPWGPDTLGNILTMCAACHARFDAEQRRLTRVR